MNVTTSVPDSDVELDELELDEVDELDELEELEELEEKDELEELEALDELDDAELPGSAPFPHAAISPALTAKAAARSRRLIMNETPRIDPSVHLEHCRLRVSGTSVCIARQLRPDLVTSTLPERNDLPEQGGV